MPKFNFTATHGVEFGEHVPDKNGALGPYVAWAQFTHDRDLDTANGERVFTFGTDDAKLAERVRNVNDYGITEVKESSGAAEAPRALTAREKAAAKRAAAKADKAAQAEKAAQEAASGDDEDEDDDSSSDDDGSSAGDSEGE